MQRNLIKSDRNQIVFNSFRLIWNQTDVRLVPNQSGTCNYNPNVDWFNQTQKSISQCVKTYNCYLEDKNTSSGMCAFQAIFIHTQVVLTLLEGLNSTSSKHAFIEPFVVGQIKCVSWIFFPSFIAQISCCRLIWNLVFLLFSRFQMFHVNLITFEEKYIFFYFV